MKYFFNNFKKLKVGIIVLVLPILISCGSIPAKENVEFNNEISEIQKKYTRRKEKTREVTLAIIDLLNKGNIPYKEKNKLIKNITISYNNIPENVSSNGFDLVGVHLSNLEKVLAINGASINSNSEAIDGKYVQNSKHASKRNKRNIKSASTLKNCSTRNTLANTYIGLVTGMNLLLGATNGRGGVEGAKFGYKESSKQTKWLECD